MRENEKQTNDPVGSEANPKASEMDQAIGGGGEDMEDWGTNHDITPPSKVQHPDAQCWLRARSFQVGAVEFGDELFGALYIMDRAPFIFFNTIALPAY